MDTIIIDNVEIYDIRQRVAVVSVNGLGNLSARSTDAWAR
jgi:hypothetical protein